MKNDTLTVTFIQSDKGQFSEEVAHAKVREASEARLEEDGLDWEVDEIRLVSAEPWTEPIASVGPDGEKFEMGPYPDLVLHTYESTFK